jgi:MFS family permease
VGNLAGLLITGYAQERFGSRKTYIAGMMLMICTIFLTVFANSIGMFMAGCTLSALPWGMFRKSSRPPVHIPRWYPRLTKALETLTTAYAAEICPINLRGLLASFVNMAWGIGLVLNVSAAAVKPLRSTLIAIRSPVSEGLPSTSIRTAHGVSATSIPIRDTCSQSDQA